MQQASLILTLVLAALASTAHDPAGSSPVAGVVRPIHWVRVSAETDGRIVAKKAEEHQTVEKGATILLLDDTLKKVELQVAEARLLEARAQHHLAKRDLERAKKLGNRDVSSEAELDRAEANERAAWAAVLTAEAGVERAGYLLRKTRIDAPIGGVIARMVVEQDEYMMPGTFVFSIMALERVKIESWVSAEAARPLRAGQAVTVDLGEGTAEASIRSVAPGTDNESRSFKVVLTADNPRDESSGSYLFRPGTIVHWAPKKAR